MLLELEAIYMRFIYDLDHTVICSRHRQATLPNGDLDLDHWIENNTPEKIARDKVLPLAGHWIRQRQRGCEIVVCTARVMGDADYQYLADHGLEYDAMICRSEGDHTPDAILKERGLRQYAADKGIAWRRFCMFSVMMDDNESVINHLTTRGLRVYNSLILNARAVA
jgi:hypothetical protein